MEPPLLVAASPRVALGLPIQEKPKRMSPKQRLGLKPD